MKKLLTTLCLMVVVLYGCRKEDGDNTVKDLVHSYLIATVNKDKSSISDLEKKLTEKQVKIKTNLIIDKCTQVTYVYKNRTHYLKGCFTEDKLNKENK